MKMTFKEKVEAEGGVTRFIFTPATPLSWQPGQYAHYVLPHDNADDRGIERWFTISSAPFEQNVWISTRINKERSSTFKQHLMSLQPGTEIEADEPEGDFTLDDTSKDYVFVIGGIGITPIRSILKQLQHDGKKIRAELLWANRDESLIPFKSEFEALAAENEGLHITHFIGDKMIDESAIKEAASKLNDPIYFVSGPEPMTEAFEAKFKEMGIDEAHARFDYFPGYEATKG